VQCPPQVRGCRNLPGNFGRPGPVIRPKQNLASAVVTQIVHQLARVAPRLVGGRVDEDVRVFCRERNHLRGPGKADVAADNPQIGKLKRYVVEIGDRPSGLGLRERAGMANLETNRDVELYALRIEGIIAAIVGRQVPQPRQKAKRPEVELSNRPAQFANSSHRVI
jgi:hypothetical protein